MKNKTNLLASIFYRHAIKLAEDKISPEIAQQALEELDEDYSFSDLNENQKKDILILLDRLLDEMKNSNWASKIGQKYENFIEFISQFKPENFSPEFLETFSGEDGNVFLSWAEQLKNKDELDNKDLEVIKYLIPTLENFLDPEFIFNQIEL
jgi:hypothetical protein